MIYIPEQWKNEKTQVVPMYITERKKLKPGKDFGGYVVLTNGKITNAAINTKEGNAQVSIVVNDIDTNYQISNSTMSDFIDPLAVVRGDVIKFKTLVSSGESGNVSGVNISMLMTLI